jgi:hypothetical protein
MKPPIAGEAMISISDLIWDGSRSTSAEASRAARAGSISTRAHCR